MYEQVCKRIDDALWKDTGCGSELDYVEQLSWILFLKYLGGLERSRENATLFADVIKALDVKAGVVV